MDSKEIPPVSQIPVKPVDQTTSVHVKQLQPVPTSAGCDLAQDLVWQRDPDCSKDPVIGNPNSVSPGQTIAAVSTNFPVSMAMQALPQGVSHYHFQIPENQTLPGNNATLVNTFPQSPMYTGLSPQDVITYVPVTGTPTVVVDTDGNRIQQNPGVQQNIAFAAFQMPQNMIPMQYRPSMAASLNTSTMQYVSMQPPSPIVQQQSANYSYPRLVPFNPQTMTLPKSHVAQQQIAQKPTTLNVTLANQFAQNSVSVNVVGTQVTSPMMTSPVGQSPTSIASPRTTESVKSPTYVYMCNKCDYVTPYRSSFKTHYCSHIQYKPYQCAYCDHSSIMKQPMQKHVKMKHAIEDSEGFTYESDQKKENIIEYICKLCRSTMNMEEAKKFYEKFEGSHERLKSGKRKLGKDSEEKEDELVTPTKRKKKFSWSEDNEKEGGDEEDGHYSANVRGTSKSPVSPRKLTRWKEDVREHTKIKKPGRPKKYAADGELNALRKTLVGKAKKFPGFRKQKKYLAQNFNVSTLLCQFCEFRSASHKGLKKHCEWRHPEKKRKCAKCTFATFFEEEFTTHIESNQCKSEQNIQAAKHESSKSSEKRWGRPRKTVSGKSKSPAMSDVIDEDISEGGNNDDVQLNCPHCNFISHPFALKRHLFFYHKECDWRCKHCGFISSSKKEVVRHSNKVHADAQPNVVQTFADITSLLPEIVAEQEKSAPANKDISDSDKIVSKHQLLDRDYIKLSKKRLVLGKKQGPKMVNNGQPGAEDKLQMIKIAGLNLKRGRKREEKSGNDQNSFVVRPKKLKIARIGFSCVYCTYAAPLRHQLRLHCYEKHTKHPACLMEFVNSKTVILEEQENFPRDIAEDNKSTEQNSDQLKPEIKNNLDESLTCEQNPKETAEKSKDLPESECVEPGEKNTIETETAQADNKDDQSKESFQMHIDTTLKMFEHDANVSLTDKSGNEKMEVTKCASKSESQGDIKIESTTLKDEQERKKEVMSCMENILNSISRKEGLDVDVQSSDNNGAIEQKPISCILPSKMNGHKFSNPFSTLIVQLNSTEIKVRDAFEGSLDDVDIYLEKFGVRTLNMDSLTPKQFEVFMRKFGNSLQPLTL